MANANASIECKRCTQEIRYYSHDFSESSCPHCGERYSVVWEIGQDGDDDDDYTLVIFASDPEEKKEKYLSIDRTWI